MIENSILESFRNSNVLVIGGTGLIGRQIVDILLKSAQVKTVSLDAISDPSCEHIVGDIRNFEFCQEIVSDADFVFHLAGVTGSVKVTLENPADFFVPMLMMNTNILEAARLQPRVKKLVYTSSIGAYSSAEVFVESNGMNGSPMDEYPGMAKRIGEMQVAAYRKQYGLRTFSVVRPSAVYGPGDSFYPYSSMVIPSLMYRIASGENPVVIWGDGSAIRDFAFSRDVAEGVILALYYGTNAEPGFVNLGSGQGCSIKQLAETLKEFIDFEYEFDSSRPSGYQKRVMDITLAKNTINYNPDTSLRTGCELTWNWFLENRLEHLKKHNYFRKSS